MLRLTREATQLRLTADNNEARLHDELWAARAAIHEAAKEEAEKWEASEAILLGQTEFEQAALEAARTWNKDLQRQLAAANASSKVRWRRPCLACRRQMCCLPVASCGLATFCCACFDAGAREGWLRRGWGTSPELKSRSAA